MEEKFTARELGRRGGLKTKELYGIDHFKKLSQKAALARKNKANSDQNEAK